MTIDIIEAYRSDLEETFGIPTFGESPAERPETFLLLERSGGGGKLSTDSPLITVEAWAPSKKAAHDLILEVRDYLMRRHPPLVGGVRVIRMEGLTGPSYEPPTTTGAFRYRWSFQSTHHLMKEIP